MFENKHSAKSHNMNLSNLHRSSCDKWTHFC